MDRVGERTVTELASTRHDRRGVKRRRLTRRQLFSAHGQWCPYGHLAAEAENFGVPHPDAAVGDAAGDQVWLVGAVYADEAAAWPVGQHGRAGARSEGQWPVYRVREPA